MDRQNLPAPEEPDMAARNTEIRMQAPPERDRREAER